jgi:ubiquinone/menaquinone biosynthesis C-methylase UbiE
MNQTNNSSSTAGHPSKGAVFDALNWCSEKNFLPEHRRYLAQDVGDRVLDLGAGTGAMFPYIGATAQREGPIQLHGIEPDPSFRARAEQKAERVGLHIDIRNGRAESLPYDNESFNTVIASTVFCTIPDVDEAIREIDRVLRPNGELRFLEHVRSHGSHGRYQDRFAPLWKRIAGGCHLNRQTERTLAQSPLELSEIDEFEIDTAFTPVKRFIRGTATKAKEDTTVKSN